MGNRCCTYESPYSALCGLTRVDDGESYRSVAGDVPNLSRTSLSRIHRDEERRRWYLGSEAEDERVNAALETIR